MSTATKLDKQINDYLIQLNDKQKRAVLTLVKTLAEKQETDLWEDSEFIAELDRRTAEFESGKVKGLSFEELATRVRDAYKAKAKPEVDGLENDFSDEDIKLFEERRAKKLSGESETYSWEEVKAIITGKY
jgi:predicted RecB family endonuclease